VRTTKAFRLFVSSTFADFVEERELLQTKVFPDLDSYCAAKGYQFYPIDLRWGVNAEAQLDHRTVEICLGEVDAAKDYPPPNLLIMVGSRYGWVPLPYAIARDEFEALVHWLERHHEQDAARALGTVYQHDENYLVPSTGNGSGGHPSISAYTLRSRADELPELKKASRWDDQEMQLRRALQTAADALLNGQISAEAREKYVSSVTEQEIVRGLSRSRQGEPAAFSPSAQRPQAIAVIREIVGNASTSPEVMSQLVEQDANCKQRLDGMKDRIKTALSVASIVTAKATLGPHGRLDQAYLEHFAEQVADKLKAAVDHHIAELDGIEQGPNFALERERAEHQEFRAQKLEVFVGRESDLGAIKSYIDGSADHPLVLYGPSGAGKSALMARSIASAQAPVIYRFIGATAASSDFRSLFVSLVEEFDVRGIAAKPGTFEDDDNKFAEQIRALLETLPKRAVIFLDALDQIRSYRPAWLPPKLPSGAKLIVSVLKDEAYKEDSAIHEGLKRRLPKGAFLEIEPLRPSDGREILTKLEGRERSFRDGQRDYILRQFEKARFSPLWLRTAFEIARSWKSTDTPGKGHQALAADTTALISQFMDELTDVHHHEGRLVARTLGLLAAAKDGLSAKELTEVLSDDSSVMKAISSEHAHAKTLPPSVWVRLHRQLAPFLIEKRVNEQPLVHFFHRQVQRVARDRYYEGEAKTGLHAALADYFDPRGPKRQGRAHYDKRSLSELPTQLHGAHRRSRLDEILTAPDWMQQKLAAFGPQELIGDYEQFAQGQKQTLIGRTLRLTSSICRRDPRQLLPQLLGRLMTCGDAAAPSFLHQVRHQISPPAILTQRPSLTPPGAEIARLEGHSYSVAALAALPDGRLASCSDDRTIRLWDVTTGAETARLERDTEKVKALAVLPDGSLASGSNDRTIRLWDPSTGAETARIRGYDRWVAGGTTALAALPGGRLAYDNWDGTIRLWDPRTGDETACLRVNAGGVSLAVLPDGRLASGSDYRTIRLWDPSTGTETARLVGHEGGVRALAVLLDGRLASGSDDRTIRLWDPSTGTETARLVGHEGGVRALTVLPSGRLASTGQPDSTIRIWNPTTCAETARLEGHGDAVNALVALADGRLASGSDDKTIRLWDVSVGTVIAPFVGHAGEVKALAVLPDGRLASTNTSRRDQAIRLWDVSTGAETARIESHANALAALADGRLASGSADKAIRLWDPNTGAETARLVGDARPVTALAVLPDGRLVSAAGSDRAILWDPSTGVETGRLESAVRVMAVLPDGRLASGAGTTIQLWDPRTGAEIYRFAAYERGYIKALAALPDGRLASTCLLDSTIRLWDPSTGAESVRLGRQTGLVNVVEVEALAVLPDGRLASGSEDNTIRLWDVSMGEEICRLELDAGVNCLAVLLDGRLVAGDKIGRLHWLEIVD
jgi:WD40 repeat protein